MLLQIMLISSLMLLCIVLLVDGPLVEEQTLWRHSGMDGVGDAVLQVSLHDDDVDGGEGDGHDDGDAENDLFEEVRGDYDPTRQDPEALGDDERRDQDDVEQRWIRI